MMRRVFLTMALMGLLSVAPTPAGAETANRIVAIVNDEVITHADVTVQLNAFLNEQADPIDVPPPGQMAQTVLSRLIDHRLIVQEARRMELVVSTDDVLDRLSDFRERFASELEFRQFLDDTGLTVETLKERMREQLLVQRTIDIAVRSKITMSPQEITEAVRQSPRLRGDSRERVEVSHLLLRVDESRSAEQARVKIEALHDALKRGTDFAELAKRESDGPYAEAGGAMGWVTEGSLMPELEAAVKEMKEGELSSPIQTRLGFHLIKVGRRQTAPEIDGTEARRIAQRDIYEHKFEQRMREWLASLNKRAYIEFRE